MANIRIKDQTTDTALAAGDYVIVDNETEGTRKFDLGQKLADIDDDITDVKSDLNNTITNPFNENGWNTNVRFATAYETRFKYFESSDVKLEKGLNILISEVPDDGYVCYRYNNVNYPLSVGYHRFDSDIVVKFRVYCSDSTITPGNYVTAYYDSSAYGIPEYGYIPNELIKHFYLNNGIAYGPTRASIVPMRYKTGDRIIATDYDMLIGSTWVIAGHTCVFSEDVSTPIVLRYSANTSKDISTDDFTGKILLQPAPETSDYDRLSVDGYYTQMTETGQAVKTNVSVGTYVDIGVTTAVENYASIIVSGVIPGMRFRTFGSGSANYMLWAWLDKAQKLLSKSAAWVSSGASGLEIEAPENAAYLVCCSIVTYQYGFSVQYLGGANYLYELIANNANESEILNFSNDADCKLAFFSDVHNSATNVQHIVDYAEDNNLNAIINGGDTCLRYLNDSGNSFDWYAQALADSSVDVLSAVGNHDVWDGALWTKADAVVTYNAIIAPIIAKFADIVQPTGAQANGLCYYYKDYGNVRVIIINAMSGHASVEFWDSAQSTWLTNVLADAKTNSKHVIICNHSPFPKNIAQRDEQANWNSWIDYRTWSGSDSIVFATGALDVIKTFVDGGGKLICLLTGHEHVDNMLTATGYEGLQMVNIASARYNYHSDGVAYSSPKSRYYDCFNVLAVDTTNCLLKIRRIGWNTDYSMKERDYFSYKYDSKTVMLI